MYRRTPLPRPLLRSVALPLQIERLEDRLVPNQLDFSLGLDLADRLSIPRRPARREALVQRDITPRAGGGQPRLEPAQPATGAWTLAPLVPLLPGSGSPPGIQDFNVLPVLPRPIPGSTRDYFESSAGIEPPRFEGGRTELEFGDVNADGHVDIVSIGDHGSPFVNTDQHGVMVWFGDGMGSWSVVMTGRFGYGGVALGDVNGDELMDVGYGMHHNYSQGDDLGDQLLEVALGDGTGTRWTPWDDGLATNGETWGMFETDFADVDNDGDLDVGSVSFGCCAGLHVYLNQGDGTWVQSFGFTGGNTRNGFSFGDVNGDGNADIATGQQRGTVYLGNGRGGFTPADSNLPPIPNSGRTGVSLGDVTGDGRDDLSFVNAARGLSVWTWENARWRDISGTLPTTGQFEATQIADLNLDGFGDLVAYQGGTITVYASDGTGAWWQMASLAWPVQASGISALRTGTDLDHNGYPDLGVIVSERISPFTSRNRFRVFLESSTPASLWVHPRSPRGGETLVAGSVRFLDWHAALPPGVQSSSMTIDLSVSGREGPWRPVAANVPNSGRYQWSVPGDLPASDNSYLRYTLTTDMGSATAVTPAAFTIRRG